MKSQQIKKVSFTCCWNPFSFLSPVCFYHHLNPLKARKNSTKYFIHGNNARCQSFIGILLTFLIFSKTADVAVHKDNDMWLYKI